MRGAAEDWGDGYITDIAYLPGYYPNQSPLHVHLACLLGGVAGIDIGPGTPLSYLELGCGHGLGALVLAASNPSWQVTGIDVNPGHIAAARDLAAAAGLGNVRFVEADLATLANEGVDDIPIADVATMHGVWSWVSDAVRAGIVALLAKRVRAGGIVQVSYNALPGWQAAIGMQRLVREAGRRLAGRSDRQIAAGIDVVRALADAGAHHLHGNAFVRSLLDLSDTAEIAYLAHEYMNGAWRPCFHGDVAAALAEAKLDWVASAQLLENFPALTLSDAASGIVQRFDDPVMRELIKDMCLPRSLRQDVFVRGARRLTNNERDAALADTNLALLCAPDEFVWEIEAPTGQATFEKGFFEPIVAALAEGPRRVRDLLCLPGLPRRDNPAEVVGMLVGTHQATRVLAPGTGSDPSARRLNEVVARTFARGDTLNRSMALATSGSGAPLACPMLELFVASQWGGDRRPDPKAWAAMLGPDRPEAEQQRLASFIERLLAKRVAIWRRLGAPTPAVAALAV